MASGLELSKDWVNGFVAGVLAVDETNWHHRGEGGTFHVEQTRFPDGKTSLKVVSTFEIPQPLQDQISKAFGRYQHNVDGVEFEQLFPDENGVISYTEKPITYTEKP
jgi:hypothetical protein